ncbi:unnamed protein product [Oncorhynchus mykiss]|uniref:Uncharacterized protein n=1 Tax=Oncorhynchus mykiss TaxID=8022 RepID=A0A060YBW4_ONCMY|nr:unnamed protein product [Oncorhynchus mykiss]
MDAVLDHGELLCFQVCYIIFDYIVCALKKMHFSLTAFVTNQDQLFIEVRFQAELFSHHITDCLCVRNAVRLCVRAHSRFLESEMFSSLTTLTPETLLDTLALLFKGPDQDS